MNNVPLVIVGASGHGKVALQIATAMGRSVVGFVDRGFEPGATYLGLPLLGREPEDCLSAPDEPREVFVAIGDNRIREDLSRRVVEATGRAVASLVHPSAILAPDVVIGDGVFIAPGAIANAGSRIGDGAILNTGAILDHDCELGPYAQVCPGCALAGCTRLGTRAFLGTGAATIPGVTIGSDAVIGAGSVVLKDVAEGVTVAGVPAKPLQR